MGGGGSSLAMTAAVWGKKRGVQVNMTLEKSCYSDAIHGKTQTRDHEMSGDPGPQEHVLSVFLNCI